MADTRPEEKIRAFIAEELLFNKNGFPYTDDTSFLEAGVLDSTNILELVMFVEDAFGIAVLDEEIIPENFDSVQNLAAYVQGKRSVASRIEG